MRSGAPSPRSCPLSLTRLETRDNPATDFLAFGANPGGTPLVEVVRPDGTALARFEAFDTAFRGGVRAVAAELDGNPTTVEVVAAAGPGGGPHVTVWSVEVTTGQVTRLASLFAFDPSFTGGVRVAAGQVAGSEDRQEIIVSADAGGGPRVRVFQLGGAGVTPVGGPLGDFFAFEPNFRGGVRVAAGELDGNPDNGDEIVVAAGPGGGPRVRAFRSDGAVVSDFFALAPDFTGGVNVDVETTGALGQIRTDADPADFSQRNVALNQAAAVAALDVAGLAGPNAVFNTLFANPSFTMALEDFGIASTTFSNNGVLDPVAFSAPANFAVFDTAFTNVFGTTALGNTAFATAFNSLSPIGTVGFATSPFNTPGVTTTGGFNMGFGTTGFGTVGSPVTGSALPGTGGAFTSTVFGPGTAGVGTVGSITSGPITTGFEPIGSNSLAL